MHWQKFTRASTDLLEVAKAQGDGGRVHRSLCAELAYHIERYPRFYLPNAANVVSGRTVDQALKRLIRLPYPAISILSDVDIGPKKLPTWNITIATTSSHTRELADQTLALIRRRGDLKLAAELEATVVELGHPEGDDGIVLNCVTQQPDGKWSCPGYSVQVMNHKDRDGYSIMVAPIMMDSPIFKATVDRLGLTEMGKQYDDDNRTVVNLCVLLNTVDAKTEHVIVPPKLQKARVNNSKPPLYDYHVLKIGGEVWDTPHVTTRDSQGGVRSHLRRGHIRHLSEDRAIWVRHTIVQGSREGFVEKEYHVEPPS